MSAVISRRWLAGWLVVLGLGLASAVQAQTVVRCDVPFDFSLGGHLYPGGVYTFALGDESGWKVALVRSGDGREGRLLEIAAADQAPRTGTMVKFRQRGEHHVLSSISLAGEDLTFGFAPTRAERELLIGARKDDIVTVLASR